MQVEIEILADDAYDQLTSLRQWLNDEDALRGRVDRPAAAIPSGAMGGGLADVLIVAVGSGGVLTALAASVWAWLQSRRSTLTVKVRVPNGRSIEITAAGPAADAVAGLMADRSDPR
jgi:hypothetical protein